jgi:hypothetical protein
MKLSHSCNASDDCVISLALGWHCVTCRSMGSYGLDRETCYTQRLTVNNAKLSKIATIHPNYSKSYCTEWPSNNTHCPSRGKGPAPTPHNRTPRAAPSPHYKTPQTSYSQRQWPPCPALLKHHASSNQINARSSSEHVCICYCESSSSPSYVFSLPRPVHLSSLNYSICSDSTVTGMVSRNLYQRHAR